MATVIRPELSSKNKYWIDKHRYYELKHFCLQYNEWRKARSEIDGYSAISTAAAVGETYSSNTVSDTTARYAMMKNFYTRRIGLIEDAAVATDPDLHTYILKAVTEGLSFTYLKTKLDIPCGKDTYYKLYRKFFWILNETRE